VPQCVVLRFREIDGRVPFDDWIRSVFATGAMGRRAVAKMRFALERLAQDGHELRRPTAAPLRDGIYELRASVGRVHYRTLYFFAGPGVAVVSHGCTKEGVVPAREVEHAVRRRTAYLASPTRYAAPHVN
jgi:phage-related protein